METFDFKTLYSGKTGELLKRHLLFKVSELDMVTDIKETDPMKIAVIVLSKQKAIDSLKDILKLTEPEQDHITLPNKTKRYGIPN